MAKGRRSKQGKSTGNRRWALPAALLLVLLAMLWVQPALAANHGGARIEFVAARRRAHRTRRARRRRRSRRRRAPAVSAAQRALAQQMMRSAYEMSSPLPLAQRVALLGRLLYTLPPSMMAGEKQKWAQELFTLAQKLPNSNPANAEAAPAGQRRRGFAWDAAQDGFREEAIATAAVRLAMYDADRSLELLDSLPSGSGNSADARTMAARLVFAIYLRRHGAAGAPELLAHARVWGQKGGFPYAASAAVLAKLTGSGQSDDAAEEFFQQVLEEFSRGREGWHGVREFAGLLERAVALQAISEESAEAGGQQVVAQLKRLASFSPAPGSSGVQSREGAESDRQLDAAVADVKHASAEPPAANAAAAASAAAPGKAQAPDRAEGGSPNSVSAARDLPPRWVRLNAEQRREAEEALEDVRVTAPQAYALAEKEMPQLTAPHAAGGEAAPSVEPKVDAELQAAFNELSAKARGRRYGGRGDRQALGQEIAHALQLVNARYSAPGRDAGADGSRLTPDAQSWALVSLAAYASPMTIGADLKAIEDPYWRAFFTAIAAQQVGQPTRVADPTSHFVVGKEEAEPEGPDTDQPEADQPEQAEPEQP